MFGKKILILVPHPDDEVVACGATIGRAQAEGAAIFALYLTHGCSARDVLWPWQRKHYDAIIARRRAEAEQAAQFLGITPVRWSTRPARQLWQHLPEALAEIRAAIAAHDIDQLWIPAYEGGNADHDGLSAIGAVLQKQINILEFAEYNFFGGKSWAQTFPYPNGTEQTLSLTQAEQAKKRAALALYKSEKRNLNYVGAQRECYRPLAPYDYSRPPHPGTLWYTRFQWVPFRHPGVDFTNPADVSSTLVDFLKQSPR